MTGVVHLISKRYGLVFALLVITVLALVAPVAAGTVTIDTTYVGGIAAAITAAGPDGTVILEPGIYYQSGITVGNAVTIRADTANGHGPSDTIIDGSDGGSGIILSGSSPLIIDNLTFRNGYMDSGGGGAIRALDGSITVTSSTFIHCTVTGSGPTDGGGAIRSLTGSITVTSSTFIHCTTNRVGGAINSGTGSIAVTSSTFTGCSANSGGGAIYTYEGSVAVTSSTFTGCSSNIHSGVIAANSGTIHFSRFYQNLGTAVYGSLDASNNWWGSNNDPSGYTGGGVITSPWLVLGVTASPASLTTAGTAVIRANLTYNMTGSGTSYDASALGKVPDDLPVAFSSTGSGTVLPLKGYLVSGAESSTFTPAGAGVSTITATVDGQTVSTIVRVVSPATKIGMVWSGHGWFLDSSGNGAWGADDSSYSFGATGDVPVTGDWNHDGSTEIGYVRNGRGWFLDTSGDGIWGPGDSSYGFGMAGDIPVTGDWNHDGSTEIGVFRNGHGWFLDTSGNGAWGAGDTAFGFGMAGDTPVTGDWNHDGTTEIGVFRNGHGWFLDTSGNGAWGAGDTAYGFGMTGDVPVTGDWNSDGTTEIGVFRNSHGWYLDASGNGAWSAADDISYDFGMAGAVPVTGKWK